VVVFLGKGMIVDFQVEEQALRLLRLRDNRILSGASIREPYGTWEMSNG